MAKVYVGILLRFFVMMSKALWRRLPGGYLKFPRYCFYYSFWSICSLVGMMVSPLRAGITMGLYTWFRYCDDVIDGEDPQRPHDLNHFIEVQTAELEQSLRNRADTCDRALQGAYLIALRLNLQDELSSYTRLIWNLMVQEYRWKSARIIPTREQLCQFACEQDKVIFGLIAILMGVTSAQLQKFTFWKSGVFTRCDWLNDLDHDLASGIVHIPFEDVDALGLDLQSHSPERVDKWITSELQRLAPELKVVSLQRRAFLNQFPSKVTAWIYNSCLLRLFEKEILKVYKRYGVTHPGGSFFILSRSR